MCVIFFLGIHPHANRNWLGIRLPYCQICFQFPEYHNSIRTSALIIIVALLCAGVTCRKFNCALTINRNNLIIAAIPQDINVSVTCLHVEKNKIEQLNNTSLSLYTNLLMLSLNRNPLVEIRAGTFDNNAELMMFQCNHCEISSFPVDFGPATTALCTLRVKFGLQNISVLGQLDLYRFEKIKQLEIMGIPIADFDSVYLPPTLTYLDVEATRLTMFPNISASRLPALVYLRAHRNDFQNAESPFLGLSQTMWRIDITSANIRSANGVETLSNLAGFDIRGNALETVPDLLGLRKLDMLLIADNSRMNCDYRMCWRRLLDWMRDPLEKEDDVTCVKPAILAGKQLSQVNPKFMQCGNGKSIIVSCLYTFLHWYLMNQQ